ncbi:type 1 glutamine amidotransferase domain-containing protein [uncultured Kordia sp.]|uniref:type 1 glutamine amidotransferase domain-containing protein n=1 Tax=uncultured Kordia sp. TaxID=507699 RepID=UPI002602A5BF|nr:type 1 glutamine amidotransferase domain-containing protein [uncultured Kordia sp.]
MRTTLLLLVSFFSFLNQQSIQKTNKGNILFVTSNQKIYGNTDKKTANHFSEIVYAYEEFVKAGYHVDFVSPKGGEIPIGYLKKYDSLQQKYLNDKAFMNLLKNTFKPAQINASNYKAVYYSGGGAAMFGVPENSSIQNISRKIYENKGVVSAVCHGTAGIANLKNSKGNYLYATKKITGFPDKFENKKAPYFQTFPFSIQEKITENGGDFQYSEQGWDNFVIVDGQFITGQDPTASATVAKKVIEFLKKNHN